MVSLTSAGDTNWVYFCSDGDWSSVSSITCGDGNIYAAGSIENWTTGIDFLVVSLTTTGNENWIYSYDGGASPPDNQDAANAIVYGEDNNVYAAGYSTHNVSSWYDFTVISLNAAGNANWVYVYNGGGSPWQDDGAKSIVYGADGNIYAAGYSDCTGNMRDCLVMSLITSGSRRWLYTYDGPGNDDDMAWSIDYGAEDNIYVAGRSEGNGTGADLTVISMGQAGYITEENALNNTSHAQWINVSPNPFSGATRFEFGVSSLHTPTSLYLYDVTGRVQDTLWQKSNQLPNLFIYRPPMHISSGVYYLVLNAEGMRYLHKVVVVR